jgi:iron only hydrogenase large subunit-like protein
MKYTAKKVEMKKFSSVKTDQGLKETDFVLTLNELDDLIKVRYLNLMNLKIPILVLYLVNQ